MNSPLEDHSDSEAPCADQGVDDSDLYGDLDLTATAAAQQSQDAWSVNSEVSDADIFQEMGVQPIDYTTEEGSIDSSAVYKKARQEKPTTSQEASYIDFENLRKILQVDLSGKSSGSDSKERENVNKIHACKANSVEKETLGEDRASKGCTKNAKADKAVEKFQGGSYERDSGRSNSNKVITENKELGARAQKQASNSGSDNAELTSGEDTLMQNKDLHFVLAMLCKKNTEDLMQKNVAETSKTRLNTNASVSNNSECIENLDIPTKSKKIAKTCETASTSAPTQSSEINLNRKAKRLPASSFMSVETSISPSINKTLSAKTEQLGKQGKGASRPKADSQWDLFDDVIVGRNDEKVSFRLCERE